MARILITGGAGFIGSHVAQVLLKRGDEVVLIDDFNNRYDPRLKEARIAALFAGLPQPRLYRGDICDWAFLQSVVQESPVDGIIHLAAWASVQPSIENPFIYGQVNLMGTINMLELARRSTVHKFVFASSSSVYGGQTHIPFRETDDVSNTLSPYAATKAAGEILCATWHNLYHIPTACLRFFTVYGPWGRPEMALFQFAQAIQTGQPVLMRGATTQRDFTYIDDIVSGIIAAFDKSQNFQIYNLGNHDSVPLPRFIQAIEAALGKKALIQEVPLPPGDIPRTLADITKAQKLLGYHPTTSIEAGVERFGKWYQDWYLPTFLPNAVLK